MFKGSKPSIRISRSCRHFEFPEIHSSLQGSQPCRHFEFPEIQLATHDFDESLVIGHGGFGKVYRSTISNGSTPVDAAIKRLDSMSDQGAAEFWAEVEMLSKLCHCNLVTLIGYCNYKKEMILVYEYMPNGTLEDHLHRLGTPLSWVQRLNICIGAGRGLHYLHTGTGIEVGVIHRDVKSSNILLHESWAAKISDFGLSKIGPTNQPSTYVKTMLRGTFGYLDPNYYATGRLTRKSDVYAFGVVLLEVLCRKRAVDGSLDEEQWNLAIWAQESIKEGNLKQIIDTDTRGEISPKCLKEFVGIAQRCLHSNPKQRSTMAEVVARLESVLMLQEKFNDSLRPAGRTIFGRMVDMFPFLSNAENSGKVDLTVARAVASISEISARHIQISNNQSLRTFMYAELVSATNDFQHEEHSQTLLETVYKGWVDERTYAPTACGVGLTILVRKKHIGTSELDLKEAEFKHSSHAKLLGYCLNKGELFCVYKLTETSLDKHLFGEPGKTSLSWVARLKIALEAAHGLSFLHQRNHPAYIQFKTTYILVDKDFNARLSHFQVDKSFLAFASYSFGEDAFYAAPEWFRYHADRFDGCIITYEREYGFGVVSEVYAFGVVLLEILMGMKVYDVSRPQGKQNLVKWAIPLLEDEVNLGMIMDPRLQHNNYPPKGAFDLALLVSSCLQSYSDSRPSMEEVLQVLQQCYQEETIST